MNTERKSILIIEDEEALCSTLSDRLHGEGYHVVAVNRGDEGLARATDNAYDLIILDLMLPDRNGLDVCRDIRQTGITAPLLFLSARRETAHKVNGLRVGADDYVTKPFKTAELMARIEALLRHAPVGSGHGVRRFGPIQVDVHRAEVTRDGRPVHLTRREFQLLRYMLERSDTSLSRTELLRALWGHSTATTRTVDVHISNLREKLESNPKRPELILTVDGVGYKAVGSLLGGLHRAFGIH